MKTLTIASINIWNFNDWEKRAPLLISTLKKLDADIVFFQEVQQDISYSEENQVTILNSHLTYPYSVFSESSIKTKRKRVALDHPISHGLGIISKIPFTSISIPLSTHTDNKESRIIQLVTFTLSGLQHSFAHVHFSNSDTSAEAHLKETLETISDTNTSIIGDFNIKDLKKYTVLYSEKYTSSSDYTNYISYPADNVSYDYLLLSKKYTFSNFECLLENVSDHRIIAATILI